MMFAEKTRTHVATGPCRAAMLLIGILAASSSARAQGAGAEERPAGSTPPATTPGSTAQPAGTAPAPTGTSAGTSQGTAEGTAEGSTAGATEVADPVTAPDSQAPVATPAPALAQAPAADKPADGGVKMTWGGYLKLDAIYNTSGRIGRAGGQDVADYFLVPGLIPVNDVDDDGGGLLLNARESRIWFKTEASTPYGKLETYVETDFYGFSAGLGDEVAANASSVRLRHAYGAIGHLLAGQTWSTYIDVLALPDILDFGSPAGRVYIHQALVRWTQPFEALGAKLDIALENPETIIANATDPANPTGARITADDNRVPDLALRFSLDRKSLHLSAAGLVREIRVDDKTTADIAAGLDDADVAFGFRLSGVVSNAPGKNVWRFDVSGGRGLGRYMALGAYDDGILDDIGEFHLTSLLGYHTSYQHWFTDTVRTNLAFSYSRAFFDEVAVPTLTKQLASAHANIIWNMTDRARLGIEYIYGYRGLVNGDSGELYRVQASARYNF